MMSVNYSSEERQERDTAAERRGGGIDIACCWLADHLPFSPFVFVQTDTRIRALLNPVPFLHDLVFVPPPPVVLSLVMASFSLQKSPLLLYRLTSTSSITAELMRLSRPRFSRNKANTGARRLFFTKYLCSPRFLWGAVTSRPAEGGHRLACMARQKTSKYSGSSSSSSSSPHMKKRNITGPEKSFVV